MKEPPNDGPEDWFFDNQMQKWLRHSGTARWRRMLAERRAHRESHPENYDEMRKRFRLGTWREEMTMERGAIERTGEAAAFMEQPQVDPMTLTPDELNERRTQFRASIRERLALARSGGLEGAGQSFRARYGIL